MTIAIHQPHFLPWMGYFNKLLHADIFVWLHDVQYRKNYFQNRTRIRSIRGGAQWLTLPVHAPFGCRIDEVTIADPRWREKCQKSISQCYCKAPYYQPLGELLYTTLRESGDSLDEVNYNCLGMLMRLLGGTEPRVCRAEELGIIAEDPTDRLIKICHKLGGKRYIAGIGGRNYLDPRRFSEEGIELIWQDFRPSAVTYPQGQGPFVEGLSIIDALFQVGPTTTREIVATAWVPGGHS